jgi:predicted DNA-binding transcriptional regulator AlpA
VAFFSDKYIRPAEFAAENGVSVATVYRWWAEGRGPKSIKLSPKQRVISREDAEAWRKAQEG